MKATSEFDKIESEADYKNAQKILADSYGIINTLGFPLAKLTSIWENNLSALSTTNTLTLFKKPEDSNEVKIPLPVVCAYYLAKKMLQFLSKKSDIAVHYGTYKALLTVCEKWEGFKQVEQWNDMGWDKDKKKLNEFIRLIVEYVRSVPVNGQITSDIIEVWCGAFCEVYKNMMSLMEKYRKNQVIGDSLHAHYYMGNAALILQHMYTRIFKEDKDSELKFELKEAFENASMVELQNLFLKTAVLPFIEYKSLGFLTEVQYTFPGMLALDLVEIVAWFVANEVQKEILSQLKYDPKVDKKREQLFKILKNQCDEYVKFTRGKNIGEVGKEYLRILTELGCESTKKYLLVKLLQQIMAMHKFGNHVKNKIMNDTNFRVMKIGDSVTAGVGPPIGKNYVDRVPGLVQSRTGVKLKIANCSIIGRTAASLVEEDTDIVLLEADMSAIQSHIAMIVVGGNDAYYKTKAIEIQGYFEKIISYCITKGARVIVAFGIPQTFNAYKDEKYRKELENILPALQKEFPDIKTIWLTDELKLDFVQRDGMHLKEAIQDTLAKLAADALVPVVEEIKAEVLMYRQTISEALFSTAFLQEVERGGAVAGAEYFKQRSEMVTRDTIQENPSPTAIVLQYLNRNIEFNDWDTTSSVKQASGPAKKIGGSLIASTESESQQTLAKGTHAPATGYEL